MQNLASIQPRTSPKKADARERRERKADPWEEVEAAARARGDQKAAEWAREKRAQGETCHISARDMKFGCFAQICEDQMLSECLKPYAKSYAAKSRCEASPASAPELKSRRAAGGLGRAELR